MQDTIIADTESSSVAWPAIFAGALTAVTVTALLFPFGSALGLAANSSASEGMAKGLTVASVIWLIIVQWLSSGLGGYLTGRLRHRILGAHPHEVFFRDTAHGFLAWGLGTIMLGAIVTLLAMPIMDNPRLYEDTGMRSNVTQTTRAVAHAPRSTPAYTAPMTREEEQKAAAKASLFVFISMLIGAFVATVAAALGGHHRDIHYRTGRLVE